MVFEDESLSYGELDARANRLAHHLRALGVGPEVVVGLCVERSPAMLVGLLGILKAGGAYLPLDPAIRRAAGLHAGGCRRAGAGHPGAAARSAARAWRPRRAARCRCARHRARSPPPHRLALDPHNPAYVIYTSGSTGTPKGVVVVTHQTSPPTRFWRDDGSSTLPPGVPISVRMTTRLRRSIGDC